ncbi:MAG TPA: alpha/beta hydrolase [Verrucomicrobiota bacterium]|nr:hypothetical protein [Verrucomicrobiales bacterium]HRI15497.1 alpha/beta hydrolase [Verrucomicrobiota bacterium]
MISALGRLRTIAGNVAWPFLLVILVMLSSGGCATPISAQRVSSQQNFRETTTSALGRSDYSSETRQVLVRFDLERQFARAPAATLKDLHDRAQTDDRRDVLFALAELNYLQGERIARGVRPWEAASARDFYLSAAIYAHLYLISTGREQQPSAFDPRFRVACELYNRGLALGFAPVHDTNGVVLLENGLRALPTGSVTVAPGPSDLPWPPAQIDRFLSADRFRVRGLTVRNRDPGLGAPLIAVTQNTRETDTLSSFPVTLFLRVNGDIRQWSQGQLSVSYELYSGFDRSTVEVDGRTIPLETDTTAPLAYELSDQRVWRLGRMNFFSPTEQVHGIYPVQPYQPGRIPVVFVHGTLSSPVRWAEMWNTLRADPVLSQRCQFWNYLYNTGSPVTLSAANFRDTLTATVREFDPEGRDPALREMVIIGHSQGGLLARLAVIEPEDRLWRAITDRSFDDMALTDEQRTRIARNLFFKPLPFVRRVIFIATPHRGSYRASTFVRRWSARFMRLPADFVEFAQGLQDKREDLNLPSGLGSRIPTSLDSMSTDSPLLLALAEIPPVPGVKAHSIIAVRGQGDPASGSDGVVKVQSARVEHVESELIIRSGHSAQGTPAAIEEVRRILREQVAQFFSSESTNRPPALSGAPTTVHEEPPSPKSEVHRDHEFGSR